jgi:hypothetical protein
MASYQTYFLTADGGVSHTFELTCANDQDAVVEATRLRGADEVEIEIWDRIRFVCWLPISPLPRTVDIRQKAALLITLLATSACLAVLRGAFLK